jgi:acyl-CoA thioester hydrolase
MLAQHSISIRVRYQETDGQGLVHHANYLVYFEQARVEMLRAAGLPYKSLEDQGLRLVVTQFHCRYLAPAFFDDLLRVETRLVHAQGVRIRHEYRVYRDETLLAEAHSEVACIDPRGRPRRLPDSLKI